MTTAGDAVRDADVITTVTGSPVPVIRAEWLKPNAHVNAVGPQFLEIDPEAIRRAAVFVESRDSALMEAGEIIQSGAAIYAELGELLSGTKDKPPAGLTVYTSLAMAVEDVAAATLIYEKNPESLLKSFEYDARESALLVLRRKMSSQVFDNLVELVVGTVGAFAHHIRHDLRPALLRLMFP